MTQFIMAWVVVSIVFAVLWDWQRRHRNAGIVDAGWALSVGALVLWLGLLADGDLLRRGLLMFAVGFWSVRLGGHILVRMRHEATEDARYANLRAHWGEGGQPRWFLFFQAQAVAALLLVLPLTGVLNQARPLGLWDFLGLSMMVGAVSLEWLADQQLRRWKKNPANAGKTCRSGMWGWSRHPNYFFEWTFWLSQPVWGLPLLLGGNFFGWLVTWFAPLVMLWLLLRATGIPHTERQALLRRGEDYRNYQRTVSAFVPWFPKSNDPVKH